MKNRFIESKKQQAKLYHRNKRGSEFTDGIIVRHLYDEMTPQTLTFWDDAVFIVNDYRVALWWTHPRYQYQSLIKEEARRRIEHHYPKEDPFADMTPNYKSRGRSRKKIVSWTQRPKSEEFKRYYALLTETQRQVGVEVAFEVRASIKIAWYDWCKGVSLCAPFEVRSETDLKALTEIARRLVKRESTLDEEFGHFVYGQADWVADFKTMDAQQQCQLRAHAVA